MSIMEKIKSHPYITGAVVVVLIVAIVIAGSSPSQTVQSAGSGVDPSAVAAAGAVQVAQTQATAGLAGLNAQIQARADDNASALEMARIQSGSQDYANTLSASIASQQINATQEHGDLVSTLSAAVSQAQIAAGVTTAQLASTTSLQTTKYLTDAVIQQAQINSNTILGQSQINATTQQQLIAGQTSVASQNAQNARPRSFFESIFG